jgi:glycosyltransferase involved in cell wall biosynthesis
LADPIVTLVPRRLPTYGQDYRQDEAATRVLMKRLRLSKNATDYGDLPEGTKVVASFNSECAADVRALERARSKALRCIVHHQVRPSYLNGEERERCAQAFSYANAVIVPAEFLIEPVRAEGAEHVVLVPNGVNFTHFRPLSDQARLERRNSLGIPDVGRVVCWVGNFTPAKGSALLERIAELLPSGNTLIVLTPAGRSEREAASLEALPTRGGVVRVVPDERRFDRRDHPIPASDLVIATSLCETVVMPVLEGLAAGVPVVSTESTPYLWTLRALGFLEQDLHVQPLPPGLLLKEREHLVLAEDEALTIAHGFIGLMNEMRTPNGEDRRLRSRRARKAGLDAERMAADFAQVYRPQSQGR